MAFDPADVVDMVSAAVNAIPEEQRNKLFEAFDDAWAKQLADSAIVFYMDNLSAPAERREEAWASLLAILETGRKKFIDQYGGKADELRKRVEQRRAQQQPTNPAIPPELLRMPPSSIKH
jgi:hypothetical protein